MANPSGWDARLQFDHYVYDYMRKSGRAEAAEIFRIETNLPIDPQAPPEIDVPDGFLHEWWLTCYDHLKAWDTKDHQHHEGFSDMDINMMNMRQHRDPALSKQHELNEQMIRELNINTEFGWTIAHASAPSTSTRWSSTETDQISQAFTFPPPGNIGETAPRESDPSQKAVTKGGKIVSNKSGRRKKKSVSPADGSNNKPGPNTNRSEASSTIPKDLQGVAHLSSSHVKGKKAMRGGSSSKKDTVKLSSSRVKGKKDEAGDSSIKDSDVKLSSSRVKENIDGGGDASSNSEAHHRSPNKDDLKDEITLGDILVKLMCPNRIFIIHLFMYLFWELEILKCFLLRPCCLFINR